jgi:membrane protein YdbS with pleckstrin-like domain
MALTKCPECGQQVSTEAVSCPHCGKQLLPGIGVNPSSGPAFFGSASPPGPEQTLWEGRPSVALLYGKILRLFIRAVILVAIAYLVVTMGLPAVASISRETRSFVEQNTTTIEPVIAVVCAVLLLPSISTLLGAAARIRNTSYKVTNQRIVIESGVLSRSLEEIDMRYVDDIEFRQTFLERLFGIGEVFVVSTDKVAPRLVLHGIPDPRKARELIRAAAYQVSQRQLFTRST